MTDERNSKTDTTMMVDFDGQWMHIDDVANAMDDDLREDVHIDCSGKSPQEFLDEYRKRHKKRYGTEFEMW